MQPEENPQSNEPADQPAPATPPAQPTPPQPGPAPNYPPPGYAAPQQPPPGYTPPGYGAQQPPPAGYPPPGQMPPPGYGYPPPGYAPRPAYVPPAPYHIPPTDGRPPEFVPAAQGTLFEAWRSLATKPSRRNYVAWAQAMQPGWVRDSVIAATILSAIYGVVMFVGFFIFANALGSTLTATATDSSTASGVAITQNILHGESFFFLLIPVFYVVQIFAIPFGHAVFMSSSLGTVRQRYERALKPWALAQVPLQLSQAIFGVILGLFFLLLGTQLSNSTGAAIALIVLFVVIVAGIGLGVYSYIQQLQSGSVGSGLIRWAVFGINLLTGFVVGIAVELVLAPLFFIFIFSQVSSLTTTTGFLPFH